MRMNYAPFSPYFIEQLMIDLNEVEGMHAVGFERDGQETSEEEASLLILVYLDNRPTPMLKRMSYLKPLRIELLHHDGQFFVNDGGCTDHIDLECIPSPRDAALAIAKIVRRHL
jgi:hypothetical protein